MEEVGLESVRLLAELERWKVPPVPLIKSHEKTARADIRSRDVQKLELGFTRYVKDQYYRNKGVAIRGNTTPYDP